MAKGEHRHYRPGSRRGPGAGRMSDLRKMWVRVGKWELILYMGEVEDEQEPDFDLGESVFFTITYAGSKKATMNLTAFTEEELSAFATFVERVVEQARPICKVRDDAAKEAFDEGDDSFIRLYRPVPEIIVRKGALPEYDEGIRE